MLQKQMRCQIKELWKSALSNNVQISKSHISDMFWVLGVGHICLSEFQLFSVSTTQGVHIINNLAPLNPPATTETDYNIHG